MSLKSPLAWRDEGLLYQIAILANGALALEAGNIPIAIVGAVLSPGTDPVGQIALSVPMIVLYLLSIILAWIFGKKREPQEE